jgi:TFIIF-interacting CTD phosphatase-like protein
MNFFKKLLKNNSLTSLSNKTSNITQMNNNIFRSDESNSFLLRTIIDDEMNNEDVFSKLSVIAKSKLPPKSNEDKDKLTIFIPMDEVLLYSYIPDENMGMYDMPKFKDYDMRIELTEYKTFAFIYFRDYLEEFLNFIDEKYEPILYTTGEKFYVDKIMNTIDVNKIFRHRLYQEDCHLYKNTKESVVEYLKDINQFTNRSLKRKILIETSTLNNVLSPDNSN